MRPSLQTVEPRTAGFVVDHLDVGTDRIGLVVRSGSATATCPGTAGPRHVASKPLPAPCRRPAARWSRVELQVPGETVRCDAAAWRAEDLRRALLRGRPAYLRTTHLAVEQIVHHLGLALGRSARCRPRSAPDAAVSRDSLLRVIRRRAATHSDPLSVYRHRRLRLAAQPPLTAPSSAISRTPPHRGAPVRPRAGHRTDLAEENGSIRIVARDAAGGYGEAIARALPQAIQGRRPMAPHGERQPLGLPRCRAQVDATGS